MHRIVVGIDGSSSSLAALRWAAQEARARGSTVRAVLVAGALDAHGRIVGERVDAGHAQREARGELDALVDAALAGSPPEDARDVEREVVVGLPAPALLDAAADADLLVVGSRGLGGFRGLLLGSVSRAVMQRARCPVVVVREGAEHVTGNHRVVVGVDGSPQAAVALDWAFDAAALRGAQVEIVSTWALRSELHDRMSVSPVDPAPLEDVAHWAIDKAVASAGTTALDVRRTVAFGSPAAAILDAAQHADLVVLGSRGLGEFSGWALGSVSHHVAQHAPCPVVVLPPDATRRLNVR